MKNYTRFIITACCILLSLQLSAQWKWGVGSNCPKGAIESYPIAVDGLGNVYEAGYAVNPFNSIPWDSVKSYFGTDSVIGGGIVLTSTDSTGHYRWAIQAKWGGIYDLATDKNNNVYAFGYFSESLTLAGHSISGSDLAGFCAKISPSGTVLWLNKICDTCDITAGALDGFGNIYAAGDFSGTTTTIGSTTLTNASVYGKSDALIIKLDPTGTPLWGKSFGGDSSEEINSIAVNYWGEIYATGTYKSDSFSMGGTLLTFPLGGTNTYGFITKINALGSFEWSHTIETRGLNYINSLAVDGEENVYITGGYLNSMVFGNDSFANTIYYSMFLARYDRLGNVRWIRTVNDHSYLAGQSVTADLCGNIWVSGDKPPISASDPMYIFKYDTSGNLIDTLSLPSGGDDQNAIVIDNKGNLYVGGDYWGAYVVDSYLFGPDTLWLKDSTLETMFIAKYSYPFCTISPKLETNNTAFVSPPAILLYPNPASDECTISIPEGTATLTKAELYDMMGRLIHSYSLSGSTATIGVNGLSPGIYTCITYTSCNNKYTNKLAIAK